MGREVIALRPGVLQIRREVLGVGRSREYDRSHIKHLRVAPPAQLTRRGSTRFGSSGSGMVAFDYGARTFHFAGGVDEAEAGQIVADLKL